MSRYIRHILVVVVFLSIVCDAFAAFRSFSVGGRIVSSEDGKPLSAVVVMVDGADNWAVSDRDGEYRLNGVQAGSHRLIVRLLGFVDATVDIDVVADMDGVDVVLRPDNLKIDEVVVTAKAKSDEMSTAHIIGKKALEHLQMNSVSDVASLLPGASTSNPDLTSNNIIALRDGGVSAGNASFGTAVEVDGVRISSNASFGEMSGVGTRNVATANVESVEVITGVPSAEYGDIGSGIVKVHTSKGRTPWNIVLSTNPRTKSASLAKGFDLGAGRGAINTSLEYAYATKDLMSPYESYTRRGITFAYNNTFRKVWRFSVGVSGNIGGMNTKSDPDANTGRREKDRDNSVRFRTSLEWLLNRSWITNVVLEGSASYADNKNTLVDPVSNSSQQPAAHAPEQGYFFADMLPANFTRVGYVDSKEIDCNVKLRAAWNRKWGGIRSNMKVGLAWSANGNVGRGEYYDVPEYAPHGYRPRPYSDYPFMHNLALFVEERLTLPLGRDGFFVQIMAGVRGEKTIIRDASYKHTATLSPRLNAKVQLGDHVTLRGGWGFAEKLPSFYILYPQQQYRDIQVFAASYAGGGSVYAYHTEPYRQSYNPSLRWQRNRNSEVGVDLKWGEFSVALTGYFNKTWLPYKLKTEYAPFAYRVSQIPENFTMPSKPEFRIDPQTGVVSVRDGADSAGGWTEMDTKVINETFVGTTRQDNGSDIERSGVEMVVDFPQINPIRTQFRIDGSYNFTKYVNTDLSWYYPSGLSHTSDTNKSYQYAGIYVNTPSTSATYNGRKTHTFSMNVTSITHIPSIRMVVTLRLEAMLVRRMQNISLYNGGEYAFNVSEDSKRPIGGSVADGNNYTAIYPLYYMGTDGVMHPFTSAEANDPAFQNLILRSGNAYQYNADGYDPYFSANLSITKEFGDHVSLSFYANNFTNSRRAVASYATGVAAIFTPDFYYGLSLRLKF